MSVEMGEVSKPAKRAAWLMIAIGVLLLAISFVSTMYALLVPEWIDGQLRANKELFANNPLLQRPALTWVIAVFGGLGLIESGLSIALGLWMLKGKRWAIATSLILTGLRLVIVALLAVLVALAAVVERTLGEAHANGSAAAPQLGWMNIVTPIVATVVLTLLIVWLVQALRAKPSVPLYP